MKSLVVRSGLASLATVLAAASFSAISAGGGEPKLLAQQCTPSRSTLVHMDRATSRRVLR